MIEIEGESEGSVAEFSGSGSTSQLVVSKKPSTSNKRKSGIFEKIKVCQINTIAFSERLVTWLLQSQKEIQHKIHQRNQEIKARLTALENESEEPGHEGTSQSLVVKRQEGSDEKDFAELVKVCKN